MFGKKQEDIFVLYENDEVLSSLLVIKGQYYMRKMKVLCNPSVIKEDIKQYLP